MGPLQFIDIVTKYSLVTAGLWPDINIMSLAIKRCVGHYIVITETSFWKISILDFY